MSFPGSFQTVCLEVNQKLDADVRSSFIICVHYILLHTITFSFFSGGEKGGGVPVHKYCVSESTTPPHLPASRVAVFRASECSDELAIFTG